MSVLDPRELEASPLADLHALAAELGLEGYRRLRKADLIKQLVAAGGGDADDEDGDASPSLYEDASTEPDEYEHEPGHGPSPDTLVVEEDLHEGSTSDVPRDYQVPMPNWELERERAEADAEAEPEPEPEPEEEARTGILDVLPNGSGFIRAEPYRQSRADIYVSPAQIRRCELRPGDEVGGPVRAPRRNERHPSLVRVAEVNGRDGDELIERPRFEDLEVDWPRERLAAPSALVDTPYGKGSRVAIGGPPGAGATSLLRAAVKALRERHPEIEVTVVLAGVRPEEVAEWRELADIDVAGGSYDGSVDDEAQVAELAVHRAKRAAERGGDAAVVIDSLDALPPSTARRAFGAGRNTNEAGSLTVLASTGNSAEPHRMATTHITLEPNDGGSEARVSPGSGTLRRELLG
jgi:transcription termination factor Rho